MIALLLVVGPSATAKVPSTKKILEKTAAWARDLPQVKVGYRLQIHEPGQPRPRIGQAILNEQRNFETDEAPFRDSPVGKLYGALLRGEGQAALVAAQVAVGETSLYHHHRRVVVIVGADPLESERPQVWLDRDTGAPVRVILPAGASTGANVTHDLRLADHDRPGTQGRFPGRLVWRAGKRHIVGQLTGGGSPNR